MAKFESNLTVVTHKLIIVYRFDTTRKLHSGILGVQDTA